MSDTPCNQKFSRNVFDDSIAVRQDDRYWSAHKNTGRFWLAPKSSAWESFFFEPSEPVECGKTNIVLVILNANELDSTLERLNSDRINIKAVLLDEIGAEDLSELSESKTLPCRSFTQLNATVTDNRNCRWLLSGRKDTVDEIQAMREYLQKLGLPSGNIFDFNPKMQPNPMWLTNVKDASENDYNFFVVGGLQTALGIDVDRILGMKGINLAAEGQDLYQSRLTVKYVLERNCGIKFVLLGLTPELLSAEVGFDCQYMFLDEGSTLDEKLFRSMLKTEIEFPKELAPDPNLLEMKNLVNQNYAFVRSGECGEIDDANLQLLEDFIQTCLEHDAVPIGLLMPMIDEAYPPEKLNFCRRILRYLESTYAFKAIDLSKLQLNYEHFASPSCLNMAGAEAVGGAINFFLRDKNVLPLEDMRFMTYEQLAATRSILGVEIYNDMMDRIFAASVEVLKRKDKIRLGFVLFDSAMWCGDELYRLFERDERYEVKVFFCMRHDERTALTDANFKRGLQLLRSSGLNVEDMHDINKKIPKQDVLIYLTPYFGYVTRAFRPARLTAETLITYMPYSMGVGLWGRSNFRIYPILWKMFLPKRPSSPNSLAMRLPTVNKFPAERMVYSGHPKTDIFYATDKEAFQFDWKMAQPDAVKIIWAPHWSIKGNGKILRLATFQFNHNFFYEYAKAHPETSWVLKPHPQLLTSAVKTGVFPSTEAFEEYLRKWDELPNAKVVTGGYYQRIFMTSDGMILDSSSFTVEYQYTQKPMCFLTRKETRLNPAGKMVIDANYKVDGNDFDGIAKFIEDVLINKHDTQTDARRKVFDAELNYRKYNGMLASEKIFQTIDQSLKG